jgi:hypothetical protein
VRLLARRRAPACDCRLCRPDLALAPVDRKALSDVREHGTHVVLVSGSCDEHSVVEPSAEPDFAYTVGLWHQRRHPGAAHQRAAAARGDAPGAERPVRARAGRRRAGAGRLVEDVLGGVPVTLEELTPETRARTVTWSTWFHRQDVPALQVVWPDLEGVFVWQGADPVLDECQPPSWRVPGPRTGALAAVPSWPFPVAADAMAFTCVHVVEGQAPALYVERDADAELGEDWSVSCGVAHPDKSALVLAHLRHLVIRSPGLREVADLPLGWWAERADARAPWRRCAGE